MSKKLKNWIDSPTVRPEPISTTAKAVQDTIQQIREAKSPKETNISDWSNTYLADGGKLNEIKEVTIKGGGAMGKSDLIRVTGEFKVKKSNIAHDFKKIVHAEIDKINNDLIDNLLKDAGKRLAKSIMDTPDYSYNKNGAYVDPDETPTNGWMDEIDEELTTGKQDIKHLLKPPAERTSTRAPTELIHQLHTHTPTNRAERDYWAKQGKAIPEYSHDEAVALHKDHALHMMNKIRDEAGYGRGGSSGESTKTKLKLKRK